MQRCPPIRFPGRERNVAYSPKGVRPCPLKPSELAAKDAPKRIAFWRHWSALSPSPEHRLPFRAPPSHAGEIERDRSEESSEKRSRRVKKGGARGRATSDSGKETQTSRRSDLGPLPASRKSRPPGTHKRCLEEEAAKRGGLGFSTVWDRCGRRFELTAQT